VLSRLDCCNGVLAELPASQLSRHQSVLYASARLIHGVRRHDHVTPLLQQLHWLSVAERVNFKLCVLVLHGLGLEYFSADTAFGLQYRRRAYCHTPVLATAHFRSQELGHGTRYRLVSPPRRSGDF